MRKTALALVSITAALLSACATTGTGEHQITKISDYSDKIPNESKIVGTYQMEIVKAYFWKDSKACSNQAFFKHVLSQDSTIQDIINIRAEQKAEFETAYGVRQITSSECRYTGIAVRYTPVQPEAITQP